MIYLAALSLVIFGFILGRWVSPLVVSFYRDEVLVLRKKVDDLHAKVDELLAEVKSKL